MRKGIMILVLSLVVFVPCRSSRAILVTLSAEDSAHAIAAGQKQGIQVTRHIKQNYKFGEDDLFEESGIIRTKWSKLMVLAGLLAAEDKKMTEKEKETILSSTDLQIDLYTYGNRVDFAGSYRIQLMQQGRMIEPATIAVDHVTYSPEKKFLTTGFPHYRATVRSFFPYDKINPAEKAEIVLLKDKKKVVFEVNFADYK